MLPHKSICLVTRRHLQRLVLLSGGLALAGGCAPDQPTQPTEAPELEASAAAARYTLVDLGVLANGHGSIAFGVNRLGWIVGQSKGRAFIWKEGVMSDLGSLGGKTDAGAMAINGNGDAVGSSRVAAGKPFHATLWRRNGTIVDLGVLSGGDQATATSQANDINDAGQVVGNNSRAGGRQEAFLWENGVMKPLLPFDGRKSFATAINAAGQVAGYTVGASGDALAFIWTNGVRRDLGTLGGSFSNAQGINAAGHVVGSSQTADGSEHGYIWKDGVMTDIGTLGGVFTFASDINAKDQIVGQSASGNAIHAFIWEQGVMMDLGSLSDGSFAQDITAAGQIVGSSRPESEDESEPLFPRATLWQPN